MKILFVCSSNVCRSPYCEYVFKKMVQDNSDLTAKVEWVRSAAVFNRCKSIHPKAKMSLLHEGFEESYIDSHKPTFIKDNDELFEQADIIIGMTKFNKVFLPKKFKGKFHLLSTLVEGKYKKIPDPFLMKDFDDYYAVMNQIHGYLEKLAKMILNNEIKL